MEDKTLYIVHLEPEKILHSGWNKATNIGHGFKAYLLTTFSDKLIFSLEITEKFPFHKSDIIIPLDWVYWMAPAKEEENKRKDISNECK